MSLFTVPRPDHEEEPVSSGLDFQTLTAHPSDMAMVPYKTLQELMKPKATMWTKVHLCVLYVCLTAAIYFLLVFSSYQKALDSNQGAALSNLGSAINSEQAAITAQQKRINGITGNLESLANQLGSWTEKTTNHVSGLDRTVSGITNNMNMVAQNMGKLNSRLAAQDQTNAQMTSRLSNLEKQMSAVPPILPAPASVATQHVHSTDMNIPLPAGGAQHLNAMGEKDYWILQRTFGPNSVSVRVMPFANTAWGIQVHNIEDGRDYLITKDGVWNALQ